jgi:hypothetical protein
VSRGISPGRGIRYERDDLAFRVGHMRRMRMEHTPVDCPWHPLPEDAIVHLVAIERRAVRRYGTGPPIEPARVVWGVWIHRDGTTHESYDLPLDVIRTLARDGGPIHPMIEIPALRLNAAVERAAGGPPARDDRTCGPIAQEH